MNRIERFQYQAALAVTGAWQGTNTDKIYEELGWEVFLNEDGFGGSFNVFKCFKFEKVIACVTMYHFYGYFLFFRPFNPCKFRFNVR